MELESISQTAIQEKEEKILKRKIEIMEIICCTYYQNQHRCLFSFIASEFTAGKTIKEENLALFENYEDLIVDLQTGFLITDYQIYERKESGKGMKAFKCYKVQLNFFRVLPELLKKILISLDKVHKFYLQKDSKATKKCAVCNSFLNEAVMKFGFPTCGNIVEGKECQSEQFQDIELDPEEELRIVKLKEVVETIKNLKQQIESEEKNLGALKIDIEEKQRVQKIKDIDQFLQPYLEILRERGEQPNPNREISYDELRKAQKAYAPKREFQRIKEMVTAKEERERSRNVRRTDL